VYFILSTLDFGVAFGAIHLLGAEQVSSIAHRIKGYVASILYREPHDPEESTSAAPGSEGLYTMIVLAWTIHKTLFLPVRVGLTAALTPKLVGWLSRRGWVGSDGAKRAAIEIRDRMSRGGVGKERDS